jgi:2-aminoadipate transaminase
MVIAVEYRFATRISRAPVSFLDELFRVSADPSIISFAGGLPSSALIDTEGITQATNEVLEEEAGVALQYTTTDGHLPLREYIAKRYRSRLGINATPDEIQIVNGSQQCLDLFAKIFLNPGDCVGMERPGYLGAIEAFSLYEPVISSVPLENEGLDLAAFEKIAKKGNVKFFYGIPNSQNPSGRTYSPENRKTIGELLEPTSTIFYEDDAFGELFFDAQPRLPVKKYLPEQTVISGSFSKIIAPGMRIGWMYAPREILRPFNIAKQAADLHSNFFCQKILYRYLMTHDLDTHIRKIVSVYKKNCEQMCELLDDDLPQLEHTTPEGGMFLILKLPNGLSSSRVFSEGLKKKVAVLPGLPFYIDGGGDDIIRMNFSAPSEDQIQEGIGRLARVIRSCQTG